MDSDYSEAPPVLQLRISLRGVSPPVWRRLLIPGQITIAQLHHVMQLAMGWNYEHLHRSADGVTVDIATVHSNSSTARTP